MTPIQAKSLPIVLKGGDLIAQGQTGSGKTAAFGLGIIQKLNIKSLKVQSLILCPTRELADQVSKELRRLARTTANVKILSLCGGSPLWPQTTSLEHGAHIIVGTPGRIEEHLRKQTLKINHLTTLVLDEADRMLDMGFQPSIDAIVKQLPQERQSLLFSATFPDKIKEIAKKALRNPAVVKVASTHDDNTISQEFYKVEDNEQRFTVMQKLLLSYAPESCVIFCNTKRETQDVASALANDGYSAIALHGDLEQKDRDQTLVRFSNKSVSVLVATDVASRGLDIENLDLVINYHVPNDPEVYVHRIGRTGRAGNKGKACTLFSNKQSYPLSLLEDYFDKKIQEQNLPRANLEQLRPQKPSVVTLQIDGGKKQKIRPGDILGALTAEGGISGEDVGKINMYDRSAYVAIKTKAVNTAIQKLEQGKLKGRSCRVRLLS